MMVQRSANGWNPYKRVTSPMPDRLVIWGQCMKNRKSFRVRVRANATVIADNRCISGRVGNLGMCGMLLVTAERLVIGDQVVISILLDGGTPGISLRLSAKVWSVVENGLGFAFENIDEASYLHLERIVSYNETRRG